MNKCRKFLSILLSVVMILGAFPVVIGTGAGAVQTKLYGYYGNNMLFQQKEEAVVSGTAQTGTGISVVLKDSNGITIDEGTAVAENNTFDVTFTAPEASYEEYTVTVSAEGVPFATLTGVVFGELWLASGQSNMEFMIFAMDEWIAMTPEERKALGGNWVRCYQGTFESKLDGSYAGIQNSRREDVIAGLWLKSSDDYMQNMSATGYFFAIKLQKELDIPVGILNISKGGSYIDTWLSRETIENDSAALNYAKKLGTYVSAGEQNASSLSYISSISTNYNNKLYPIRKLKIAGMIWYQGESDLIGGAKYGEYKHMLKLLQEENTKLFGYENGKLPMVITHIASYLYTGSTSYDIQAFNAEMTEFQSENKDRVSISTISDLPLDFNDFTGNIHPSKKQPVGERMAHCALGLVYSKNNSCSAPYYNTCEYADGKAYITLDNAGDGLKVKGEKLDGFYICGDDGVYYTANAEIIDTNKVCVWNDNIKNPVSVAYSMSIVNSRSNLYSTENGEYEIVCSPFVTNKQYIGNFMSDYQWMDCENEKQWKLTNGSDTKQYDLWETDNCSYLISADSRVSGSAGLSITADKNRFSIKQTLKSLMHGFGEVSIDFNQYPTLSFYVRNDGDKDVVFNGLKINTKLLKDVYPEIVGTGKVMTTIPNDGQWHKIDLNLNNLYLCGTTRVLQDNPLDEIWSLEFEFSGKDAKISIDGMELSPVDYGEYTIEDKFDIDGVERDSVCFSFLYRLIEKIKAFFKVIFE